MQDPMTDTSTTTPAAPATAELHSPVTPAQAPSKWAIHRRLYDWVLSFSHRKHSTTALFVLSFTESSFFPIPPDVLLMPLALGNRRKAFWFAAVCTVASVLGAIAGYFIGWGLWHLLEGFFYRYIPGFTPEQFAKVGELYEKYNFWIVFIAAFTPIPYKVITIAGGVFSITMPMFIIASIVGRGMRFFMVAGLMWLFGPPIVKFVDKYFNLLSILFTILLIGGFAVLKMMH